MTKNKTPFNSLEALLDGKMNSVKKYPEHFYDYPEVVQQTLFSFYDTFKFPEGAVPKQRQKGKYALWVEDLHKIEDICGTQKNVRKAFDIALERYNEYSDQYKFIIWRPLTEGMEKLLIASMMKIRLDEEKIKLEQLEREESKKELASDEKKEKLIKNLKSMFEED